VQFATLFYFKSQNPSSDRKTKTSIEKSRPCEYEDTLGLLNELYNCSDEQLLVNQTILMQTILFMIQETNELDPKLIEFVRSIIHKPSGKNQINLMQTNRTDFSQIGQSKFMDTVLNSRRNGFFLGGRIQWRKSFCKSMIIIIKYFLGVAQIYFVSFSKNTIFFELERDWTGLLIEPVPSFHMSILSKKRNIFSINACIANERPFIGKFSGRLNKMHKAHVQRIDEISKSVKLLYVPCFSLNTIMSALGVNKVDKKSIPSRIQ